MGIHFTTITKINMLNMTYPIFVFLISPVLNKEKIQTVYYLYLILTITGLYFIIIPNFDTATFSKINIGDLFGLISGLFAAIAITSLRQARKYDSSYLILFYLMATGSVINLIIVIPYFIIPEKIILIYTILATITSVAGQIFITVGYKHISAAAGSLVSSTRIIFAIILGASLFSDPISIKIILGGLLILISLFGVSGVLGRFKSNWIQRR